MTIYAAVARSSSTFALICFSHLRWNFVFQRPQRLMTRLARSMDVLFWEEPIEDDSVAPWLELCENGSGVTVAVPHLPADLQGEARTAALCALLDDHVAGIEGQLLRWYHTPMMLPFSRHLEAACTVYDCMDELKNFRFAPPELMALEQELFAAADLVFTGGYSLYEAKRDAWDDAEADEAACFAANCRSATALALAAADREIATVSFSSDLVFDGSLGRPYREDDPLRPLGAYGRSKAAMESAIEALGGQHLIVRTAAFFSPWDPHNFAMHAVEALAAGRRFAAAEDQIVSPAYVPQLSHAVLDELIDGTRGILHLANQGAVSWADFAVAVAAACGLPAALVDPVPGTALGWKAARPPHVPLASQRMPTLQAALRCFANAPEVRERIARAGQGAESLQPA